MAARALASVLLLVSVVAAQAPPGFKTYENRLAELTFCYSTYFKEVPLPPTEQLLVAKFVLQKTPRELKKVDERILKAATPELRVFVFEDASAPTTQGGEAGEERGPSTVREAMEARSRVESWEEFVKRIGWKPSAAKASRRAEYELFELAARQVTRRMSASGWLARRRIGSKVIGVYGWTLEPHHKKLKKIIETMAKSLDLAESDLDAGIVEARIDRIYRKSKLGAIEWRKKVRRGLAKGWQAVDTENYLVVHHTKNRGLIKRITRDIEAMRSFYIELFPPSGDIDRVSVLRLCQTKEEYHQYGGPPNTGGYWHPGNEELVLYDYSYTQRTLSEEEKERMGGRKLTSEDSMLVLRHEAFHQYIFYAIGEFSPHDWFNEGYGDYFSGAVVHSNTGRVRRIAPSPWRIDRARLMCGKGKGFLPLQKILEAERAQFYNRSRIGDYYAGAWSFVYFLKESKEAAAHPQWSQMLATYFGAVKQCYHEEISKFGEQPTLENKQVAGFLARKAALKKTLAGIDVAELEKVWKQWVADL